MYAVRNQYPPASGIGKTSAAILLGVSQYPLAIAKGRKIRVKKTA